MEWLTTSTVLDRLRDARDDSAWASFVERFRAPITSFGRKLGLSPTDAEDAAQETLLAFLEAHRRDAYDRGRGRLSSYLFAIAHNKIRLARRKIARHGAQITKEDDTSFWAQVSDPAAAQQTWEEEWRRAILTQCLAQVRQEVAPQTFEAFRLVVFEHVAPAEAAARLGLSRNAVFIAKHRIGTRLRILCEALEQEE